MFVTVGFGLGLSQKRSDLSKKYLWFQRPTPDFSGQKEKSRQSMSLAAFLNFQRRLCSIQGQKTSNPRVLRHIRDNPGGRQGNDERGAAVGDEEERHAGERDQAEHRRNVHE